LIPKTLASFAAAYAKVGQAVRRNARRYGFDVPSTIWMGAGLRSYRERMHVVAESSKPLSRREAAEFLNCSVGTLHRWAWRRTGPRYSRSGDVRGRVWYQLADLQEWLESRKRHGEKAEGVPGNPT
jgi:hypothetical protein